MWHFQTKKSNASKNWHAKAMLVDPRKTKITIINNNDFSDLSEDIEAESEISGTPVSFVEID